jgi:hypothetical protein
MRKGREDAAVNEFGERIIEFAAQSGYFQSSELPPVRGERRGGTGDRTGATFL